jgi:hypothetical protein
MPVSAAVLIKSLRVDAMVVEFFRNKFRKQNRLCNNFYILIMHSCMKYTQLRMSAMMKLIKHYREGTPAELIDREIYIAVSRVRVHWRTVAILSSKMILFAEEKKIGEVYTAPF